MRPSITTLQQVLFELNGLPPAATQPLFALTHPIKLGANDIYIPEGDRAKKLAFIEQGIIRAYRVKDNGDDATLFLRWEGQFVASHDTIIHGRPSRYIYRALEDTSLLELDYDELESLLKNHPEYEPLRNFFLMKMLAESLDLIETFVTLSPEERYRRLVKDKFDIVNRVQDKHLASMLGITPVSLSRIRKRIQHARAQQ